MAEFKTNVMRLLEKENVAYTAYEYPHGKDAVDGVTVAAMLGQDPARVFKTLVTQGESGGYFVFVVPVGSELDLKKCAKSVGEKHVEMIHVKDIMRVTGYVRGGCSPLGMKKLKEGRQLTLYFNFGGKRLDSTIEDKLPKGFSYHEKSKTYRTAIDVPDAQSFLGLNEESQKLFLETAYNEYVIPVIKNVLPRIV